MSAELLRRAADEMHRDAQAFCAEDNSFYHAVANWLGLMANVAERDLPVAFADHAVVIARAYLGESE